MFDEFSDTSTDVPESQEDNNVHSEFDSNLHCDFLHDLEGQGGEMKALGTKEGLSEDSAHLLSSTENTQSKAMHAQ